jgi:hypothetical protein
MTGFTGGTGKVKRGWTKLTELTEQNLANPFTQ